MGGLLGCGAHIYSVVKWKGWRRPSDYNPDRIPIQWDAWLRHTRRQEPSLEVRALLQGRCTHTQELAQDLERIRMVQHNANVLEMRRAREQQLLETERQQQHAQALGQHVPQTPHEEPLRGTDESKGTDEVKGTDEPRRSKGRRRSIELDLDPLPDTRTGQR